LEDFDAVWAYYRFAMSLREVEDLLAAQGVIVSHARQSPASRPSAIVAARPE
jgi:hypothetical protein